MLTIRRLRTGLKALLLACSAGALLAACSGGSGRTGALTTDCDPADPATAADCATVLVAVTDAEGDFTSYAVDVLSISLERANGTRVETLPAATRIDFAALTELSELVSAATIAPADIVGGHVRVDYSNAEIFVESGDSIVPAAAVDQAGAPLGIVDVQIRLDARERLVLTRGRTHLLQIDFDLEASHVVNTASVPAVATTEPLLVAEVQPVDQKELRVRGALVDVDTANGTYEARVRPWFSRIGDHGVLTVATDGATEFEIDGEVFVGESGLDALATQPAGTLTVAFGVLDPADRSFTASVVHAGDSLGGDDVTAIHGNIVARTGNELVVKGAFAVPRDRPARFFRTVIVQVGPDTGVTRRGAPTTMLDADDLSVGQRIVAFGTLTNPAAADVEPTAPDVALLLDASAGRVRMLPTRLHGVVNSWVPGQVNMALRAIDRLGIGLFSFAGTGASPAADADPADYEVATGPLPLAMLEDGRPLRIVGFVSAFGAAPPDFTAHTLIGPRELRTALGIGWGADGTAAPFMVMSAESLVPDLTNADIDERHHMLVGPTLIDLLDLPAAPAIGPATPRGLYAISAPGHVELFGRFAEFVDTLALRLGGGEHARSLAAYGSYDDAANALESRRVVVHLQPAE